MYFKFAWRYFKAKKSANAINIIAWVTIGVIAFATCCQLLVLSVFNGFEALVKDSYAVFYSDVKIIPASGKTFKLSASQFEQLKKQPFVESLSVVAEEKALLQNGDAQSIIYLKGVDNAYTSVSAVVNKITKGVYETGTLDSPKLVIGAGIQHAAGVNLDGAFQSNNLTLILPKKNVQGNDPIESLSEGYAKASGVFSIQQEFDNKYALTNIEFVKQQMNLLPDEFCAVEIKLNAKEKEQIINEKLKLILGDKFTIQTKYQQNTSLYQTMQLEKWAIYAVLTLILVIAAFNMISALTMLVLEKKKDIAILQSIGSTKGAILKIFLTEGLLLGIIGSVLGISLALLVSIVQLKTHFIKLNGGTFLIDYFPVKIEARDILLVAVTAIIIAFIASFFPAIKASGQPIELK